MWKAGSDAGTRKLQVKKVLVERETDRFSIRLSQLTTTKYHRLEGHKLHTFISCCSSGQMSEARVPAWSGFLEDPLSGCLAVCSQSLYFAQCNGESDTSVIPVIRPPIYCPQNEVHQKGFHHSPGEQLPLGYATGTVQAQGCWPQTAVSSRSASTCDQCNHPANLSLESFP